MNNFVSQKRGSSALLILLIIFVFMICSLFLILYGANVYQHITTRSDIDFARRMGVSYITNKIRACEIYGGVEILTAGDGLLLCAAPEAEVPIYTYIYIYNGFIMEYITDIPEEFDPENGEQVTEASELAVRRIPGGVSVTVGTVMGEMTYTVSLRYS